MLKVLVVDDQASVRTALELLFEVNNIPVTTADSPEAALDLVAREDIGLVIQDMNFRRDTTSGEEGVELMRRIRKLDPDIPIVLITAFTSLEMAVRLVKEGANDYLAKPWDDDKLITVARNLLRMRALQQENLRLTWQGVRARRELQARFDLCDLVYESAPMHDVVSLAVKVSSSNVPVLITGPNGCGKEKLAEIVFANSRRKGKPFVRVNSGGLHDNLIDAELFGAEAGAFTGATKTRI
jgi:DNA-binding NtrC family response regulator